MKFRETFQSLRRHALGRWTDRFLVQRWFDIGLRGKMSALVTVGLIGLITVFAYLTISSVRQTTQQLLNEHVLRARILAENLDSNIGHVAGVLTILSSQVNLNDAQVSLQTWGEIFEQDFPAVRGIYLLDADMQVQAITLNAPHIQWVNVPLLQSAREDLSRIISTEGLPRPYAVVAVPIVDLSNGRSGEFIAALLDLSDPGIFMSSGMVELETEGNLQVLDAKGEVLVSSHPDRSLTAETIEKITTQLSGNEEPRFEACLGCSSNGLETGTIIVFASLSQIDWSVVIWHDSQDLFAPVRIVGYRTLVLTMITILGALGLVVLTTRSVIEPVQKITNAAHQISDVPLDPSTFKCIEASLSTTLAKESNRRRDELGVLANSFITMCTRLQQSMDEIQSWNRELDARVQVRTQELSILNAVALTVNQSLNLDEILERALDEVIKLTDIDVIAIYIHNPILGKLELHACRGLSEEAAKLAYQVGMLDSDCGGVMELGKAIIVPDISSHRGKGAQSLQRENITSLMHVPLTTKGWSFGSMCVGTRECVQFDEQEQELLSAIANQIAIAVENARLYADLQRKEWIRGELFKKTLAAQEDERKRIARELHDEISQSLTALLYDAEDGLEINQMSLVKKRLQSICNLSKHTLDNVHKLMFDLRPAMLDQLGLIPALRWLSETRLEPKGVRVSVITNANSGLSGNSKDEYSLSPEVETALYRVVQEAINNIARHAAARNVEIRLFLNDRGADFHITDDGIGFDMAELSMATMNTILESGSSFSENTRGLGLLGMQERIQLLGGEMEIVSSPGNGTRIKIHVPIEVRSLAND